ncbi:MAG TPA: ABC transporter substrate-binding protein [Candidatus Dormibacteraeota bacterium]|nr:ABC transporter substrate-binding protein [Candidatus Dormibacteraeota bacterium]
MPDIKRRPFHALGLLAALVLVLAGCGSSTANVSHTKTLPFGVNTMLSGVDADTGLQYEQGVKLAVHDINAKGGVQVGKAKYLLKPDVCDNQSLAPQAVQCGHLLAEQDHDNVMLVPLSSAALALEGFNVHDQFVIIANAGASNITTQGNPLIVQAFPSFVSPVPSFLDQVYQFTKAAHLPASRVVAMESTEVIGAQFDDAVAAALPKHGAHLVKRVSVDITATDFSSDVTQALQAQPNVMVLTESCLPASQIMKEARSQGYTGSFFVYWGCDPELIAPAAGSADYHSVVGDLAWVESTPTITAIKKEYAAKYHSAAGAGVGGGYADVQIYAAAIHKAGTVTNATTIRAAMNKAVKSANSNVYDITGFDSHGNSEMPVIPTTFYNGKVYVVTPSTTKAFLKDNPGYSQSTDG